MVPAFRPLDQDLDPWSGCSDRIAEDGSMTVRPDGAKKFQVLRNSHGLVSGHSPRLWASVKPLFEISRPGNR